MADEDSGSTRAARAAPVDGAVASCAACRDPGPTAESEADPAGGIAAWSIVEADTPVGSRWEEPMAMAAVAAVPAMRAHCRQPK